MLLCCISCHGISIHLPAAAVDSAGVLLPYRYGAAAPAMILLLPHTHPYTHGALIPAADTWRQTGPARPHHYIDEPPSLHDPAARVGSNSPDTVGTSSYCR
jgi:hypothetical protein